MVALSTISDFRSFLSLVQYDLLCSTCFKLQICIYECKTWLLKYLLFWTLFFKGPVRISPPNARSLKDKGGTMLHGPNTCAFVISKVQHDLMLTSKVNRSQGTIIHACESSLVLNIIKTITSVYRINLNLQLCLSVCFSLSLSCLSPSLFLRERWVFMCVLWKGITFLEVVINS